MAVQVAHIDNGKAASNGDFALKRVYWGTMANGDTGQPVPFSEWADRTVHVFCLYIPTGAASVIGASGTVALEGSNDYVPFTEDGGNVANPGTWSVLTDQNGVAMSYTANTLKQMTESPLWVRPHVIAGDGTTACNVVLVARRMQSLMRGG